MYIGRFKEWEVKVVGGWNLEVVGGLKQWKVQSCGRFVAVESRSDRRCEAVEKLVMVGGLKMVVCNELEISG